MNHVQILHSGDVQNLHAIEGQILPAGSLDAGIACLPEGIFCPLARMQDLPLGLDAEIARWRGISQKVCI
jgi:hypothetical protein